MSQKAVSLKALVDRKNNRVIFAESNADFSDALFSFLTMPMGTIIRLIRKQSPTVGIGCMNNLYESVENIEKHRFQTEECESKSVLLYPRNGAAAQCENLKLNIVTDDPHNIRVFCYNLSYGVFIKGMARLIVTDQLHVMPPSTKASFSLLSKVGVTDGSTIEECNLNVGVDEVLNLLKCSLVSKMPLTETFLKQNADPDELRNEYFDQVSHDKSRMKEPASNKNGKVHIKLFISKSKNMVCYAEASEDFVDLLFSFLTVPLGYIVKEMHSSISNRCINHLYNGILELDTEQILKSIEHKAMLINPKPAPEYENNRFGIYSFKHSNESTLTVPVSASSTNDATIGGYMKGPAVFTVTDNLIITPISPISGLSVLKNLVVPFHDIKECDVSVGREEALHLLVASFVSESALTSAFLEMPNPES